MKDKIIIITGPTGVGKTKYSIEVAKKYNGEIISCDSFQIYKYMDIGTAKIKESEMDSIIHHNIDIAYPFENYNTSLFQKRTLKLIDEITARGKTPILVGGTGLYLYSITHEINFSGGKSNSIIRKNIEEEVKENGLDYIYNKLVEIDNNIEKVIEKNNKQRIIRAYEIYLTTGESPYFHLKNFRNDEKRYNYLYLILSQNREDLYTKINLRVDEMIEEGLVEEVKDLLKSGITFENNSFKAIGYKEFKEYFYGDKNIEYVIDKIKQSSRNYAKRQLTWFRRVDDSVWVNYDDFETKEEILMNLFNLIEEFLNN